MSILKRLLGCIISLALLSGCWDAKEIEKMAYVTALGIDYVDGQYITYAQVLNFSNIAKNEAMEVGKAVPTWIGQGKGKTVSQSVSSIYNTAQERVFWGHVRAIVFSENLLKSGEKIQEAYSSVNRYREIRYNILFYGTKEPIAKLFALKSLLNFSPIESILSTPQQVFEQFSIIKPKYVYKLIADSTEGSGSNMIPSLSIDKKVWLEDEEEKPLLKMNGAYLLSHNEYLGWLSADDLKGARWLQKGIDRIPTNIPDSKEPMANVVIIKPRNAIIPKIVDGEVQYNVKITVDAYLNEVMEPLSDTIIKIETAKELVSQIRKTYEKGLSIKSDTLNLEDSLYRSHSKKWNELHKGNPSSFVLTKDSLQDIEVKVHVIHSGKYKFNN